MPISIYPPTLASAQPAFLADEKTYNVYFTLQSMTGFSSIGHIQIRVVDQQSNASIVNTALYPDGIIYKAATAIKQGETAYYIPIVQAEDLRQSWVSGRCYKIQLRFGTTGLYSSVSNFAAWKKEQVNNETFSEWSTVMVIKAIDKPNVEITNVGQLRQDTGSSIGVENTLTPLFTGIYSSSSQSDEFLDKYSFSLYDEDPDSDVSESLVPIETTGEIQVVNGQTSYEHRFKTILTNNELYYVVFSIKTVNGYEQTAETYKFQVVETYLDAIENLEMRVYGDDDVFCRENGCLKITLNHTKEGSSLTGGYILTRTSETSDYGVYEELKYFNLFDAEYHQDVLFIDYTVESGIRYKYGFQYQNKEGLRSAIIEDSTPRCVNFEYSYLYRDGAQLRLSLNQKLSSFKHTTLSSKQDTLGDKYPHLVRNGYAKYAEFPISGTISFHMDEDQTFFTQGKEGYYFGNDLILPKDKFAVEGVRDGDDTDELVFNTNLTGDNIFIERKFREKAEEFLNDFTYKLYKSPTEGNIVIGLMNISMTPNATLGRMIFDFSATAYEVMDNTLEKLNEIGIIDIGEWSKDVGIVTSENFGQVSGIYDGYPSDGNIMTLIKQQEEIRVGGRQYKFNLTGLKSFWVERYPEVDLTGKINELDAAGEDTSYYEGLKSAIASAAAGSYVRLKINGAEVLVAPNRYYAVDEVISSLELVSSPYPIIINYIAALERVVDDSVKVVSKIDVSKVWGQISGVFTEDASILQRYNYNYNDDKHETLRVYSYTDMDKAIRDENYTYIIADDTSYNLYKTKNLYEIIQEETRKLVAYIYEIKDGFKQDEEGNWTDGTIYYSFSDITSFTIEADPYTELKIGKDEESAEIILLGPTGRYTVSPMEHMVKYIELPKAQFAIVDFKCTTTQTTMK